MVHGSSQRCMVLTRILQQQRQYWPYTLACNNVQLILILILQRFLNLSLITTRLNINSLKSQNFNYFCRLCCKLTALISKDFFAPKLFFSKVSQYSLCHWCHTHHCQLTHQITHPINLFLWVWVVPFFKPCPNGKHCLMTTDTFSCLETLFDRV